MGYKRPADDVVRILDAPPAALVAPSPDGFRVLLVEREAHPPIALLARPHRSLAGVRVDPATGGQRTTARVAAASVLPLGDGPEVRLQLPDDRSCGAPVWSPDGRRLAVVRHAEDRKELWIADPATGRSRAIDGLRLRDTLGLGPPPGTVSVPGQPAPMLRWTADGRILTFAEAGAPPDPAPPALGPRVEETRGRRTQMPTFQDLLRSDDDESLFERYATSRLVLVGPATGEIRGIGEPGLLYRAEPSPDGAHLLVERLVRPFSRRVPWRNFARRAEVWSAAGTPIAVVADLPVADEVARAGVPTGPRMIGWRSGEPASLVWVEALDRGDPAVPASHRDRLLGWRSPFAGEPVEHLRAEHRVIESAWIAGTGHLLLSEWDRDRRWRTVRLIDLDDAASEPRLVFDLSVNDAYGDPGVPVTATLPSGHAVVVQDGGAIYLAGAGASEDGDRPFLDRHDLASGAAERLFHSPADAQERFVCFVGGTRDRIVVERQSPAEPPGLLEVDLSGGRRRLTTPLDPHPELSGSEKRLLRYRREDGVPLSAMLHLPPGWRQAPGRLPMLLWAYPLDYSDPGTAGQVRGSDRAFVRLEGSSPLWLLLRGWAVLQASVPVVGDPDHMNDTLVDQVVASLRAAIDAVDRQGVLDRRRVVVIGHSYGAFMVANAMAHSDLFAAGIARSGAYNRTLTPFGFQTERRTYWEARDVYHRVSPFAYADRIDAPLLLVHGAEDGNTGTFPVQSERLFQAIQGHGGTARLVVLPHEDHAYRARESVQHVIAETMDWVERHVPAPQPASEAR